VSLLDKYVNWRASTLSFPSKFNELEAELRKISPELDTTATLAIVTLPKEFLSTRTQRLQKKYIHSMGQTDSDVVKVIDITDGEFKLIKKVRDRIAHGEHPGLGDGNSLESTRRRQKFPCC